MKKIILYSFLVVSILSCKKENTKEIVDTKTEAEQLGFYKDLLIDKTFKEYKPETVTGIMLDPKTGEVLAMANRPCFNPNEPGNIANNPNRLANCTADLGPLLSSLPNVAYSLPIVSVKFF